MAGQVLADSRTGKNNRHTLTAQFRQSVFGRLAGYEDVNDADRLGAVRHGGQRRCPRSRRHVKSSPATISLQADRISPPSNVRVLPTALIRSMRPEHCCHSVACSALPVFFACAI